MAPFATKTVTKDISMKQPDRGKTANFPNNVKPVSSNPGIYTAKVKQADLILFTTQLSVMLDSGVALSDALDSIAESRMTTKQGVSVLSEIINNVADSVKNGESFSKALASFPRVFGTMFVSMVKASEMSGRMSDMLNILSGYLNFEYETRKKVKSALTYPIIMAVMAVVAVAVMMLFVLPRFIKIYESREVALPALTQALVNLSRFLGDAKSMTVAMTILMVIAMVVYSWMGSSNGRKVIDLIKIRLPVVGTMFIDLVITRSMRIMSTMLNTGVSILDTIEVIQNSTDNYYFKSLWAEVDKKIRDGLQLSEAIRVSSNRNLIAPGILQMFKAGEKGGKLGDVSDKISIFYEKKLEGSIKSVMTLIEPLMITALGTIIGTIAIAMLMPVFKISSVVSH